MPKSPSQTLISDVRMDLLTLLDEVLHTLDSILPHYSWYAADIRERMALESIRALKLLYSRGTTVSANGTMHTNATLEEASRDSESSQASHPHRRRNVPSRKERLASLARKDAVTCVTYPSLA